MPVDALLATRPVLPYTDAHGNTVDHHDDTVLIFGRPYSAVDALDLSAAIARAVTAAAEHRINTPTTATEGA